jgi:RNA polymerase sigma-70 factor, ECF subfamily
VPTEPPSDADKLMSDEELVSKIVDGPERDVRVFEHLVSRYQSKVLTNCRYLANATDADDLAQEVFVKAYFALDRFEGRSMFKTWIQRIKVNHCLNFLQRKRELAVSLDDPALDVRGLSHPQASPLAQLENRERQTRIQRVLRQMSETLRVPLVLREVDHCSYREIAGFLGLGESAVKMRVKRAREEFRRRFVEAQHD